MQNQIKELEDSLANAVSASKAKESESLESALKEKELKKLSARYAAVENQLTKLKAEKAVFQEEIRKNNLEIKTLKAEVKACNVTIKNYEKDERNTVTTEEPYFAQEKTSKSGKGPQSLPSVIPRGKSAKENAEAKTFTENNSRNEETIPIPVESSEIIYLRNQVKQLSTVIVESQRQKVEAEVGPLPTEAYSMNPVNADLMQYSPAMLTSIQQNFVGSLQPKSSHIDFYAAAGKSLGNTASDNRTFGNRNFQPSQKHSRYDHDSGPDYNSRPEYNSKPAYFATSEYNSRAESNQRPQYHSRPEYYSNREYTPRPVNHPRPEYIPYHPRSYFYDEYEGNTNRY